MARVPRCWMLWRAWEADTVGSRSIGQLAMHNEPLRGIHYVRDEDEESIGASWLAIMESSAHAIEGKARGYGGLNHLP